MGAGKRVYSFSPGVYSMFSLQFFWVWEGGLGKMHNKYLNKQTKNKKQITEKKKHYNSLFMDSVNSLCSFVIIRVKTCPQEFLPGRTIGLFLSLDGYGLGRSLVDVWLAKTFREGVALGFILSDTKKESTKREIEW